MSDFEMGLEEVAAGANTTTKCSVCTRLPRLLLLVRSGRPAGPGSAPCSVERRPGARLDAE